MMCLKHREQNADTSHYLFALKGEDPCDGLCPKTDPEVPLLNPELVIGWPNTEPPVVCDNAPKREDDCVPELPNTEPPCPLLPNTDPVAVVGWDPNTELVVVVGWDPNTDPAALVGWDPNTEPDDGLCGL